MNGRSQSGQVLPLIALTLAALMGFAGMAVDVGYLEYWNQQQQAATDAAAIGGAQYLAKSNCSNATSAKSAATADATQNGFTTGGNVAVNVVSPPSSGPYASNSCAVSVQIQTQHVATFFARLFGYPTGMTETTSAVGTVQSNTGACIYLLSTTTWSSFQATLDAPGCAIAINYNADFNSGSITSPSIGTAGPNANNFGSMTFPMASPMPMLPVADPCPEIPGCSYLASNPPSQSNCSGDNVGSGSQTIQPGCYTYLNFTSGSTVTFAPGLYVITQNFNTNGAIVQGTGVTIYIPSGGNGPNFDNETVTLSPPTTGNYANVLFYQVPGNSSSINFNGPNVKVNGLIYAPSSTSVNFDEGTSTYAVLVFGAMNFNGPNALDIATPPPGQSLIKQGVLAQ